MVHATPLAVLITVCPTAALPYQFAAWMTQPGVYQAAVATTAEGGLSDWFQWSRCQLRENITDHSVLSRMLFGSPTGSQGEWCDSDPILGQHIAMEVVP